MKVKGKRFVVLYLTDAQMRLLKSLGVDCRYLTIPVKHEMAVRYMVRVPEDPKSHRMYLTNWQRREVMDESGEACDFIELSDVINLRYGIPPAELA